MQLFFILLLSVSGVYAGGGHSKHSRRAAAPRTDVVRVAKKPEWTFQQKLGHAFVQGNADQELRMIENNRDKINTPLKERPRIFPLSLAIAHNRERAVAAMLFFTETDVDVLGFDGKSPLHFAAKEGFDQFIQQLLRKGAKVDPVTTEKRQTPLHFAAKGGYIRSVQYLIEAGADKTIKDSDGKTPVDLLQEAITGQLRSLRSPRGKDGIVVEGIDQLTFT